MNNFMDFIIEDITTKKELLSAMPLNNKTNTNKYNDKIDTMLVKYTNYKKAMLAFMEDKLGTLEYEKVEEDRLEGIKEKIKILEQGIRYYNPYTTPVEKCGFGSLMYNIKYYNDFTFDSMNRIIEAFVSKFEECGIILEAEEFETTCYTFEYMTAFLENRKKYGNDNYDKLNVLFENIYWKNSDLLKQISMDFRCLINDYYKEFEAEVSRKQKEFTAQYKFKNYDECVQILKKAYEKLYEIEGETIDNVVNLARQGLIDINNYKKDSKIRHDVFNELVIDSVNIEDDIVMEKIYENFEKLERNVKEYIDYNKIAPLIEYFKTDYETKINENKTEEENKKKTKIKTVEKFIEEKREDLAKINKQIKTGKKGFKKLKEKEIEDLKEASILAAKELRKATKIQDNQMLMQLVIKVLKQPVTIENIMFIYYCFDYMKRDAIRKVFGVNHSTEDVILGYKQFDSFALNPTHFIINNLTVYEESNINSVIVDNYRINGINITEESLKPENLEELLNKIKMLIRVKTIKESPLNAEQIWFIIQVEKILKKENQAKEAS